MNAAPKIPSPVGSPADAPIKELKAIAHPLRFRILEALCDKELNVGEIEAATAIAQPALSQQLGVLRRAGLVETRKQAKLVYYRLKCEEFVQLADAVRSFSGRFEETRTTRKPAAGAANFARIAGDQSPK